MTPAAARTVANAFLGAVAAAGAVVVLRRPPWRRRAAQLVIRAVTTWIPLYLTAEVRRAWQESGRAARARDRTG